MTQAELNREVAQATGESVDTIAQMGFVVRKNPLAGASGLYVSPSNGSRSASTGIGSTLTVASVCTVHGSVPVRCRPL
jgi:hypothetical protein